MTRAFVLAAAVIFAMGISRTSLAANVSFYCVMDGPSESPSNGSPGTGVGFVDIDAVAHTMHVHADWSGLTGTTTASHIHAPTLVPLSGTAGVATTTPFFAGFPIGVTAGTYDNTLDMTLASSYNPAFVTANGGTTTTAEAALFSAITTGRSYLNIHSTTFGGGEIRGFLIPLPEPTSAAVIMVAGVVSLASRRRRGA